MFGYRNLSFRQFIKHAADFRANRISAEARSFPRTVNVSEALRSDADANEIQGFFTQLGNI